ncbi:chaperonin 10-like protein [Echria macrotheca]|uniref:Chaperonin 10-like protein n=1 Tax=Echria macrotheca TaxID=438768 RepID=A0AAJ0BLR4_9PEZI|nr:chaperonin 10-like protein [Echria macrotheca]
MSQSGITVAGPNEPYKVVDSIPKPKPQHNQALVKSLYVGLNPVEPFMQHTGVLVTSWPAVIGSDFSGVVVETGPDCKKLSKGDIVYGCAPVGIGEFSPFQETFLVNEDWVFKKSENVALDAACTVGAGILTAALALLDGQHLTLPTPGNKAEEKDSWIIVMGGSGSVGRYCCQLASLCGYKVLASCSPSKNEITLQAGASATFNNRASVDEQVAEIEKITGGKFGRVVDASAQMQAVEASIKALETVSNESTKYFATVDDWSPISVPESINLYRVQLGKVGRDDELGKHVTAKTVEWIPTFEKNLESGELRVLDFHLIQGEGWDKIIEGIADMEAGKLPKKPVVKVQDA